MSTAVVMSISYIIKLVFVTLFSVGLGAHTVRFNFHYRNYWKIGALLLIFLAITTGGILSVTIYETPSFKVNKETNWSRFDQFN
jgi:uncharacterized integral membrane protein